jgi:hypothetical protein
MATNALYIYTEGGRIFLDPTPFVSISVNHLRDHQRSYGEEYDITLNGYIMTSGSAQGTFNPPPQSTPGGTRVGAAFEGQERLREYFTDKKLRLELNDVNGACKATYFPILQTLDFEEGTYWQYCKFTATFKAYDKWEGSYSTPGINCSNIEEFPELNNPVVISSLSEDISIEPITGEYGYCYHDGSDAQHYPITNRYFKYTRTLQATGKPIIYDAVYSGIIGRDGPQTGLMLGQDIPGVKSCILAKSFLYHYISDTDPLALRLAIRNKIFSDTRNVDNAGSDQLQLYNWERSEQENVSEGSYSITDTFIIAPTGSKAIETFSHNITNGQDSPYHKISIDGTIKGLSEWIPEEYASGIFDTTNRTTLSSMEGGEAERAKIAYQKLTSNGQFGNLSSIYKRCNALTGLTLNSQPLSVAIGTNPINGEITYNLEFDSRPTNFFSKVMSEKIEVTDTYPGDVFAVIPILGRPTGPVLQYTYGRTEFKRDLSIEVILDQTWIGYGRASNLENPVLRRNLLYSKPSLLEPFRGELDRLIGIYSPANEPGIRRYFQNAPSETWNATEGRYTLNLSWTYELSE